MLTSEIAQQFFAEVNRQAKRFISDQHFTVDEFLIQAWASQKSFRKKDGSDDDGTNFHGQQRKDETYESTTDRRCQTLQELWQGLASGLSRLRAGGEPQRPDRRRRDGDPGRWLSQREAALLLLEEKQKGSSRRITARADKAYDTKDFVAAARALNVTAHVMKNEKGAARTWIAGSPGILATRSARAGDGWSRRASGGSSRPAHSAK